MSNTMLVAGKPSSKSANELPLNVPLTLSEPNSSSAPNVFTRE